MEKKREPLSLADIEKRIAQLYAAIGQVSAVELKPPNVKFAHIRSLQGQTVGCHLNFDIATPDAELEFFANAAVHTLSAFYDACMNFAQQRGIPAPDVQAVTANCLELRVIRDLDNFYKHQRC